MYSLYLWLDFAKLWIKEMTQETQNLDSQKVRMILKFDTGADGFLKMIYVLVISAIVVLMCGTYFLLFYYRSINNNL